MKYKLKVYSIWEFGMRVDSEGNPHQEDSMYPAFGKQNDSDRTFVLCDGMGGHDAGEVASATVCETVGESIKNDGHDAQGVFTDADLSDALGAAYDALDKKDTGAAKKMGTTFTFLKLHEDGATMAHIGDSRVYHIRPGKTDADTRILYQSEDHSLINDLVKMGELTHEEARHSGQKNVITRAMQPLLNPRPKAEVYKTSDIKAGDYFYLCSDGMLEVDDMEDGSVLKRIFSDMVKEDERKVEILKGATNENKDNHTAFIIHILEVEGEPVAPPIYEEKDLPYIEEAGSRDRLLKKMADQKKAAAVPPAPAPAPAQMPPRHQPTPMAQVDDEEITPVKRASSTNTILLWGVIMVAAIALVFVGAKFIMGGDDKKPVMQTTPTEDSWNDNVSNPSQNAPKKVYYDAYDDGRPERIRQKDSKKGPGNVPPRDPKQTDKSIQNNQQTPQQTPPQTQQQQQQDAVEKAVDKAQESSKKKNTPPDPATNPSHMD